MVSTLSDHYKVSKLADFFRNIAVGLLGIFMTVFLGVISVQGASTAATDGLTIRTAKFIAGNFIPVVGKMFTDATDTVMSASVLLKNTVGVTGLGILFMICVFPLLKVLSLGIIFNLSAAILQPLGGTNYRMPIYYWESSDVCIRCLGTCKLDVFLSCHTDGCSK